MQCPPMPVPFATPTLWATGLAYEHGANRLWITYSDNVIRVFQIAVRYPLAK